MNKVVTKNKYVYYLILLITGWGFFFLLGQNDYVLYTDSMTYLEPSQFVSERYIIYPLFLNMCRNIFGENNFLSIVYWIQGTLAIVVSWISVEYFRKRFELSYFGSALLYFCLFLPYGYSLPESVATHHILTEGLSYTLFHFFLLQIVKSFLDTSWKNIAGAFGALLLLVLLRGQLLFLVPVFCIYTIAFLLRKGKIHFDIKGNVVKILLVAGCLLVVVNMAFIWLIGSGKFLQATTAVSGRVLCLIEEDDEVLFEGHELSIYHELYNAVMKSGTNADTFRPGLRGWEDIANASNENTKIARDVVQTYYVTYMSDRVDDGINQIIASMSGELLQAHYVEYWGMTMILCLESLVLSIFIQPSRIFALCNIVAVFLYIFSMFLFVKVLKIRKNVEIMVPYIFSMIALLGNVVVTNLLFYGMQRYIVYTFGYFYLSLILMLAKLSLKIKEE